MVAVTVHGPNGMDTKRELVGEYEAVGVCRIEDVKDDIFSTTLVRTEVIEIGWKSRCKTYANWSDSGFLPLL